MRKWFVKFNTINSYSGIDTVLTVPNKIGENTIEIIGDMAFSPENTKVKEETRNTRKNITSVTIEKGIKAIGRLCFAGCTALREVIIPESVNSIGKGAFDGCESIESIVVPPKVRIEEEVFKDCKSLKSFTFPDKVGIS